ncbi:YlmG [Citrus sinensis]|nr:ylmG homolog protein 1-2, chloroplastic [Citrus sinensis]KAH9706304.1 YlmG [Citrus sinensis]
MATASLLLRSPVVFPNPKTPHHLLHHNHCHLRPQPIKASSSSSSSSSFSSSSSSFTFPTLPFKPSKMVTPTPLLADSTRTVSTIFSLSGLFIKSLIQNLAPTLNKSSLHCNIVRTVGPAFFARMRERPSGYLNTPLTVVAAGLAKWLDIYSGVLLVRVLLSWFPNIPWDRQPLSAIRDLCDPYLNLFRNIIPPVFDTLDVSPLLAFAVLGTLGSILNNSRGM